MSAMLIFLVLFTEENENAVEEGGEEQQGPQKPKKVSVLFLIISICPNVLIVFSVEQNFYVNCF